MRLLPSGYRPAALAAAAHLPLTGQRQHIVTTSGELRGTLRLETDTLLTGEWKGYCSPENLREGAEAALPLLAAGRCTALLTDNSRAFGDWSDLLPWLLYDYFPRLREAGVQRVALVRSPDPAARLACTAYARHTPAYVELASFDDATAARQWLGCNQGR